MSGQGLNVRYGIVSLYGWWQGFEPECWGSPYSAETFSSPMEALAAVEGLGWKIHVVTVITNVPETPL